MSGDRRDDHIPSRYCPHIFDWAYLSLVADGTKYGHDSLMVGLYLSSFRLELKKAQA